MSRVPGLKHRGEEEAAAYVCADDLIKAGKMGISVLGRGEREREQNSRYKEVR